VFRSVGPLLILLVLNARLVAALNRRRRRLDRRRGSAGPVSNAPTSAAAAAVNALTSVGSSARRRGPLLRLSHAAWSARQHGDGTSCSVKTSR